MASQPNSAVKICNLALDHLKQDSISSIDAPETKAEVICARHYHQVRRATLRIHPWNFALKRAQLSSTGTAPAFGYTHAFNLPNDFVRLLTLNGSDVNDDDILNAYELENGQLLYNASSDSAVANIRYVYDHQAVSKWDPLFIEIFTLELALAMAYAFTGVQKSVQRIGELLRAKTAQARAIDGQERPPKRKETSRLLLARRGRSTRRLNPQYFPET